MVLVQLKINKPGSFRLKIKNFINHIKIIKKCKVYKGVGPFWVKIEYIKLIKIMELNLNFRCQ